MLPMTALDVKWRTCFWALLGLVCKISEICNIYPLPRFTCCNSMAPAEVPDSPSTIADLPDEVLATVVNSLTLHARGNPGDVCRLMLVRHR